MLWIEKLFTPAWSGRRAPGDLCAALAGVMTELTRDRGDWQVKWGDVNRHQRFDSSAGMAASDARPSLPIAGGHGSLGVGFCFLAGAAESQIRYGDHGHSYVGAVEFTAPIRSRSILPLESHGTRPPRTLRIKRRSTPERE